MNDEREQLLQDLEAVRQALVDRLSLDLTEEADDRWLEEWFPKRRDAVERGAAWLDRDPRDPEVWEVWQAMDAVRQQSEANLRQFQEEAVRAGGVARAYIRAMKPVMPLMKKGLNLGQALDRIPEAQAREAVRLMKLSESLKPPEERNIDFTGLEGWLA